MIPMNDRLVIYFSQTKRTEKIANLIGQACKASPYPIQVTVPYSSKDLDWTLPNSRANQEMENPAARPDLKPLKLELTGKPKIFLGYPLWWSQAPRAINTFLDTYDLSGYKLYLFCTSGSSSINKSVCELSKTYPQLNIQAARRFANDTTLAQIETWLKSL